MPNLPKGTEVAEGKCAECGKPVVVTLNKNGNAYYYCRNVDERGQPCSHHERWGKAASQRMQRAYLDARGQGEPNGPSEAAHGPQTPANDNRAPDAAAGGDAATRRAERRYAGNGLFGDD